MKKNIYVIYFIIVFFLFSTINSWGFSKENIPYTIKVGLRYGDTSASIVNLHSNTGFEFGYYRNNIFNVLLNFIDEEDLTIRKDTYYMKVNDSFIEVFPEIKNDINFSQLKGPYHVEVGDGFSDKTEMLSYLERLKDNNNVEFYPVYDNGWRIWTGLFSSQSEAENFININGKIDDKNLKVVNPNNKRIQVLNKKGDVILIFDSSSQEFHFAPFLEKDSDQIITVDGKRFRGEIIFKRYQDSDMTVINYLTLQEYLYGVLPKEMSGDWPLEALKAQAVAARNYAVANIHKHSNYGFDLCGTIHCQVYGGYDVEKPRSNMAVDATDGKLLTYKGKIISAFFHSNSGGYTEDSENVWSLSIPYIRGVKDDFSLGAPNSNWTQIYSPYEIAQVLSLKGINIGEIYNIYPEKHSKNGRVLSLKIKGTLDEITLEKEETRKIFGYNNIKSMNFKVNTDIDVYIKSSNGESIQKPLNNMHILKGKNSIKILSNNKYNIYNGYKSVQIHGKPSKYIFNGRGWGHGLGMSQWGAKKMAELGYTYQEILQHYYTGTKLE